MSGYPYMICFVSYHNLFSTTELSLDILRMEVDNRFRLENTLIRSFAHFRSFKLDASFKALRDLHFDGMPDKYDNCSMNRMAGSLYLMNAGYRNIYSLDIDAFTAKRLELEIDFKNCFIEGEYMLVVRLRERISILRGLQEIGEIEFKGKYGYCKNGFTIFDRYAQQVCQVVYAVDNDRCLYQIKWQDIKDGKYCKTLVRSNVEHFYADRRLGLATVNQDSILSLDSANDVILLTKLDLEAKWTIVICKAKCWIVSGDISGHVIMASISKQGDVRSTLELKLTSNGSSTGKMAVSSQASIAYARYTSEAGEAS